MENIEFLIEEIESDESPSTSKVVQFWTDGDTRLLFDLYASYLPGIGPMKKFKNKKAMWAFISNEIPHMSAKQCEERFKTVMRRKKVSIDNNNTSGSKRRQIDFEEEQVKICRSDDSIEPEVQMSSHHLGKKEKAEVKSEIKINKKESAKDKLLEIIAKKEEAKETKIKMENIEFSIEEIESDESPSTSKAVQFWTDGDTRLLLDLYASYLPEIGPMKKFKNKKAMWAFISNEIPHMSAKQCEERFKTVTRRKKVSIDNNNISGSKRRQIDFEEEVVKICRIDDSIEPEVQMSSHHLVKKEKVEAKTKIKEKESAMDKLLEIIAKKEEAKERRHRERMKEAKEIKTILMQILEAKKGE